MNEENKEFIFDHVPTEFPMRQLMCERRRKAYEELGKKFPYRISIYGDQHIGKMNWWQRLKMRYKLRKLKRM